MAVCRSTMITRRVRVGVLVLAGGVLLTRLASAANGNPGRDAYFRYCSSCHGDDGRGGGEVATSLRQKPTDLTTLAKAHGGTFPYAEVKEIIDGRKRVAAHGSPKMPVWGAVFADEKSFEQPAAHAQSQIEMITSYLASIQN